MKNMKIAAIILIMLVVAQIAVVIASFTVAIPIGGWVLTQVGLVTVTSGLLKFVVGILFLEVLCDVAGILLSFVVMMFMAIVMLVFGFWK